MFKAIKIRVYLTENQQIRFQQMFGNNRLIGKQGWRSFREMLSYKCQWYGKKLQIVNPANTTQTCSQCGYQMNQHGHKIKLGVESWTCPQCDTKHDRDHNAAINILRAAINKKTIIVELSSNQDGDRP